jgi:hypothetical protein
MPSKGKQLCLAHLQRDLIGIKEMEQSGWAKECLQVFKSVLALHKDALEANQPYLTTDKVALEIEGRLDGLLKENIDHTKYPLSTKLQAALLTNRANLFNFLYDLAVPPDNNAFERAIRNIKVKMKVSGQFKSRHTAFAVLRSVIDTAIKQKKDVFQTILNILLLPKPKIILATI